MQNTDHPPTSLSLSLSLSLALSLSGHPSPTTRVSKATKGQPKHITTSYKSLSRTQGDHWRLGGRGWAGVRAQGCEEGKKKGCGDGVDTRGEMGGKVVMVRSVRYGLCRRGWRVLEA